MLFTSLFWLSPPTSLVQQNSECFDVVVPARSSWKLSLNEFVVVVVVVVLNIIIIIIIIITIEFL